LNILFLDQFSEPGGAQLCLQDLMPEVLRRGWNPLLMAPGEGDLVTWAKQAGIPTDLLPLGAYSNGRKTTQDVLRYGIDFPRLSSAIRDAVKRHRVDMVYVNGPRVLPAVAGVALPVVFHAHSLVCRRIERGLIAWTLRNVGASVIAVSDYAAEPYLRALNSKHVTTIYNGVADLSRGPRNFSRQPARIGIIGRIAPEKGHVNFLRAAREMTEHGVSVEFHVYGASLFGDTRFETRIHAMAKELPVTFHGWTNDVPEALQELEILAVPSGPEEAATRVILEAFSAGTPVVACRAGGIPEIVEHNRTGILTASSDPGALAESLGLLMSDPDLMERLSAAGRREWQRRFRIERFRTAVCEVIENHARTWR
jgi:glycosyltransferase involved in cell wall biosynthesis